MVPGPRARRAGKPWVRGYARAVSKRAVLGFVAGVRALFGGVGFVVSTPSAWGWAMIPVLAATLLFGGSSAIAIWGGSALSERLVADAAASGWSMVGMWALRILFWGVGIIVAFVIAMSLAQPLSGFALDAVARKQELALGGKTWTHSPFLTSAFRSLRVSVAGLVVGLPVLAILALVTVFFPPAAVVTVPLKFLVAGVLTAYDLLDYPLSLRGEDVGARLRFMRANFPAVLGFGVAAATVMLVPGGALFLLPFGVAGAARLVNLSEKAPREG